MFLQRQGMRAGLGCLATVAAWVLVTGALAWGTAAPAHSVREPGPAPLDALVALVAAAAGWACLSWLALALAASLVSTLPTLANGVLARLTARIAPISVRRFAGAMLGLAVVTVPVVGGGSATAATAPARSSAGASAVAHVVPGVAHAIPPVISSTPSLDRPASTAELDRPYASDDDAPAQLPAGWTPDRPAKPPKPHAGARTVALVTSRPHPGHAATSTVTVRRGDTLWDIAARSLGAKAGPLDIAREWPRWYAANRQVIGPDPGALVPGDQLVAPPPG